MNIFLLILCSIIIIYSALMLILLIFWTSDKTSNCSQKNNDFYNVFIKSDKIIASVIVTVRNEQENILNCLFSLTSQKIENLKIEIIISDDFSTDKTTEIVEKFIETYKNNNFSIQLIKSYSHQNYNLYSKKYSQEVAIKQAQGEIIILTDADCIAENKWIITILNYFNDNMTQFVSAPVHIKSDKSFFSKLQALEFASLIISGGALIYLNKPVMANAANLAFRKSSYIKLIDNIQSKNISSGDDIFLMSAFKKVYGNNSINFIKEKDAIVYTKPQNTFKDFIHQRIRWASKAGAYKDFFSVFLSLTVFFANLSILILGFIAIFLLQNLKIFLIAFIIKAISEFVILYVGLKLFNLRKLLYYFIPMIIIYPFYIFITPILSLFYKPTWKGRKIKT